MIDRITLLIFTPSYPGGLRPEMVASVTGQQTRHWLTWEIGRLNPYPAPDLRNVLAQYSAAREMCLRGPYDALLTVEHDMILPPHAVQRLCDTPAPVVYGTYLLRHGEPVLNAWQYIGTAGLGMSLDRAEHKAELRRYQADGVGRVSGCGFGCTLIRRQVLEAVPFRGSPTEFYAPDMPFALDCVRKEIVQVARFDVACGHMHEGVILEQANAGEEGVKVTVLQDVNILIDGSGVALHEGDEIMVPAKQAEMLASLGYVKLEEPAAPKVPRRK